MDKGVDPETTTPRGRAFGWLTGPVKLLAAMIGASVSIVLLMSVAGLWIDSVWIQLVIACAVTAGVPLVVADRLLPKDGSARPGLVSDILAMTWMGGATATLALGTTILQVPLDAQAARFDDEGWSRAAWATRWTAGVPAPDAAALAEGAEDGEAIEADGTDAAPTDQTADADAEADATVDDAAPAAGAEYTPAPEKKAREELEPAELFEKWAPSVVTITVTTPRGSGMGTGFVIDERGTIATNNHVVAEASKIEVKLFDGTMADEVEILETNPERDLAVLRIKVDPMPEAVVLGSSADVVVGEAVIVIGNPIGLEHTMTDGMVSSRRVHEGM